MKILGENIVLLIFLFLSMISCGYNIDDDSNVINENLILIEKFDENGKITERFYLINDKVDGDKEYFKNGVLDYSLKYKDGNYMGIKSIYDSVNLGKEIIRYYEVYNNQINDWVINEEIAFNSKSEIDTFNSYFSTISSDGKCLNIFLSDYYSYKMISCKTYVFYDNIKDSILPTNYNFQKYCLPDNFKGEVKIEFELTMPVIDSFVFETIKKMHNLPDSLVLTGRTMYKNFMMK
jgi:hypothetical protein